MFLLTRAQEVHSNQLEFTIQDARNLSLGSIFGRLERNKQSLNVLEYSLSQTSIERVSADVQLHCYLECS